MSEMIKRIRGLMIGRWQRIGPQIRDPASYRLRTIANVPLSPGTGLLRHTSLCSWRARKGEKSPLT